MANKSKVFSHNPILCKKVCELFDFEETDTIEKANLVVVGSDVDIDHKVFTSLDLINSLNDEDFKYNNGLEGTTTITRDTIQTAKNLGKPMLAIELGYIVFSLLSDDLFEIIPHVRRPFLIKLNVKTDLNTNVACFVRTIFTSIPTFINTDNIDVLAYTKGSSTTYRKNFDTELMGFKDNPLFTEPEMVLFKKEKTIGTNINLSDLNSNSKIIKIMGEYLKNLLNNDK